MGNKVSIIMAVFVILLISAFIFHPGQDDSILIELTENISKLPKIETDTIESFEKYHQFADNVNDLIELLNRELGLELPVLEGTRTEYEKLSKIITEYSPLINNYNEVIDASRKFDINNSSTTEDFYVASVKFGLETAIIFYTVWSGPAYKTTGYIYRITGLNKIAVEHPACVSIILGEVHWFIRTYLVETSSDVADFILRDISKYIGSYNLTVFVNK